MSASGPGVDPVAAPGAPGAATPRPPEGLPGGVDVWERWLPGWHVFNLAVLGITTLLALQGPDLTSSGIATILAVVGGLAAAYWAVWIRRGLWDQPGGVRVAYVLVLLAAFAILLRLAPAFTFLQFTLYAQVFFCLPQRWAIVAGLSIGGILAVDTLLDEGGDVAAAAPEAVIEIAAAAAFTMLSAWIGAIIEQSAERQVLLRQLAETRAELAAAEREAGMLEERARLSREIHDTLAQGFASVVTHLEAADATLAADVDRARDHLRAAEDVARASLDDARGLVWALRPASLADGGLPAALERTVAAAGAASPGPAVDLTISGVPRPLHPDVEVGLLRAAQEGLANARRHADASRVSLTLTYFDDEVALDVVDDGRGFDPTTVAAPGPGGGHGLRGMSERTERLGGRLEVESHLGEGTTIALALPALAPPDGLSPASTPGSAPGSTAVPAPTLGAAPVAVPTPAAAPPPGGSA